MILSKYLRISRLFCIFVYVTKQDFDSLGGDKRIERRVNSLFDKMVEKQSAVINKCFEDKAPKVGAYRVLRNKNWDVEDLIDRIRQFSGSECVGH